MNRLIAALLAAPLALTPVACGAPALNSFYWSRDPSAWAAKRVEIHRVDKPGRFCGELTDLGCTTRINETRTAVIYVQEDLPPELDNCVTSHEIMHAAGFRHDGKFSLRVECAQGRL